LKNGDLPPWRRPWSDDPNSGIHTSLSTGTPYRGINQLLLQVASKKYQSKWWGTFNQIAFNGGNVRRGEKATKIVLWKPIQRKRANEQGKEVEDSFLIMREFAVFNIEQCDGLDKFQVGFAKPEVSNDERYEHADLVISSIGAEIRYGRNSAHYNPSSDTVCLPYRHQFESPESFYETAFHELAHFSEHPTRLNWNRAEEGYQMGELIAEISSCMMMGELGLSVTTNLTNHASYLSHWLEGMGRDPKYIFKAASQASKVVDYLMTVRRTMSELTEALDELIFA